jgi:hypothetical protein
MRSWSVLAAAIVLAGCLGSNTPVDTPNEGVAAADPLVWTGGNCDGREDAMAVNPEWAAAHLPAGMVARRFYGHGALLELLTLRCAFSQPGFSSSRDQVTLAGLQLDGSDLQRYDLYLVRAYHEDGASPLAQALADVGMEVMPAAVGFDDWGSSMAVVAEGEHIIVTPDAPPPGDSIRLSQRVTVLHGDGGRWVFDIEGATQDQTRFGHATLGGGPYPGACPFAASAEGAPCDGGTVALHSFLFASASDEAALDA